MKILVINLMHIGDLLLVTPVLRTLRANFPKSYIALLADRKLEDLVKYNENLSELITIDKKGFHNKLGPYLNFVGEIRKRKFDIVINLHANERASFIAAFSGGKKIVGYSSFGLGVMFDALIKNRKAVKHQVEAHFDVLRECLKIGAIDDQGIEMTLDAAVINEADSLWNKAFFQNDRPVIGLNIGASWPTKRWPAELFAELADKLIEAGFAVAYFGGDVDRELVDKAVNLMTSRDNEHVAVFTGKVSLMKLAALLKKCRVLVTNDSGPMHVAVAMKVPIVSIFGASPVTGFSPYNETSAVLTSEVACRPCDEHHCKRGDLACMYAVSVEKVFEKTRQWANL